MAARTRLCVQLVFQRDQTQVQRAGLLPVVSQARPNQGVVTYRSYVEAFVTGIKIESSDQSPL